MLLDDARLAHDRRMKRIALVAVAVLAASTVVAPVRAQELEDRSVRFAGGLVLGMAGELDSQVGNTEGNVDLEPSVGFDLRSEVPVADFLVIGGWLQFLSFETDASESEREETFGIDGFVRGRWVFDVAPEVFLEPYVLVPIGLTLAVLPDSDGSGDDIWPGFNTGVFAGVQVLHGSGFGGFVEVGWRHAEVFREETLPFVGDVDLALVVNEVALNLGVVFSTGGR